MVLNFVGCSGLWCFREKSLQVELIKLEWRNLDLDSRRLGREMIVEGEYSWLRERSGQKS